VFCFDGSWNLINEGSLTNVALTAAAISRSYTVEDGDEDLKARGLEVGTKIPQIVHYDEGVGTNRKDKYGGGMFGKGLFANVKEAYLFLCLNYEPGDELYMFGFSRGAYTARSFAGLIGNCGIMRSEHIEKVIHAAELYKARAKAKSETEKQTLQDRLFTHIQRYGQPITTGQAEAAWKSSRTDLKSHAHQPVDIRYIGLWDTVKSILSAKKLLGIFDPSIEFHDEDIPETAFAGRHAVALDEHRKTFDYTPWRNINDANRRVFRTLGVDGTEEDYLLSENRLFQEVWFPGSHGAVGGGGERRGLSDNALLWVLEGARQQGLTLNTDAESKVFKLQPTPIAYVDNTKEDGVMEQYAEARKALPGAFTRVGPRHISGVSLAAIVRYAAPPSVLPAEEERKAGERYRPDALQAVEAMVEAEAAAYDQESFSHYNGYIDSQWETLRDSYVESGWHYELYTVKVGDTLSGIAAKHPDSKANYQNLQAINKIMVPDPEQVFAGQVLSIPIGRVQEQHRN